MPSVARDRDSDKTSNEHTQFQSAAILIVLVAFIIGLCTVPIAANEAARVKGEILIQLDRGSSAQSVVEPLSQYGLKPIKQLSARLNIWLYEFADTPEDKSRTQQIIESVRRTRGIQRAQFNHYVTERTTQPNDPLFGQQWSLNNIGQSGGAPDADIDAIEAWDTGTGGTTTDGREIVIAVVDNGFDLTHPDLQFWKNVGEVPGNGIDDDSNGYVDDYDGWNAISSSGVITGNVHGTHVAGIAAARGNNNIGVSGVNWGAKVLPVVGVSRTEAVVVEAYGYVLEMRARYNESNGVSGAFIVSSNSSFGIDFGQPEDYPLWCAIYDSLGQQGILNAGATANLNIDVDAIGDIPTGCASDFLISVTNTTDVDSRNSGAAFGLTTIDLGAPGTDILSTVPGGGYSELTGCSMATPHVAGAIALMWSVACPRLLADYRENPPTTALLMKQLLLQGTDPIAALMGSTVSGGRLNVRNSVDLVRALRCGVAINHVPLADTRDTTNAYLVRALISSDTALVMDSLLLHFRTDADWVTVPLAATGDSIEFSAAIPPQSPGTRVEYYLEAHALDGTADTTRILSFEVIDFDFDVVLESDVQSGAISDTLIFPFSLANTGLIADSYAIMSAASDWLFEIVDGSGYPLDTTGIIVPDNSLDFAVRVVIPTVNFGAVDSCEISVRSNSDSLTSSSIKITAISAGYPIDLPISEQFPIEELDDSVWAFVAGATIDTLAENEISAPYSLRLNGSSLGSDTVVTRAIDLRGATGVSLDYYVQQQGGGDDPEFGDDLLVEYFNKFGKWSQFRKHLGSSPITPTFQHISFGLPSDAYHAAFAVRIRNIAGGIGDDWFVDDFALNFGPQVEISSQSILDTVYTDDSTETVISISNSGALALEYTVSKRLTSSSPRMWLSLSKTAGTVESTEVDSIVVRMLGTEMASGAYFAELTCRNNDADALDTAMIVYVQMVVTSPPLPYSCGDADNNHIRNISDVVFIVSFIFAGGQAPVYFLSADANCDGGVTISDAVFLINYIFAGGPAPCAGCQ